MQRVRVLIHILVFCILSVEILYYLLNKRVTGLCALCFLCSQLWRHLRVWRLPKEFKKNCLHVWRWWKIAHVYCKKPMRTVQLWICMTCLRYSFIFSASFKENTVFRLCEALSLPTRFVCSNGTLMSLTDGVQLLLRRLLYLNRLNGMKTVFNSSKFELSYISNTVMDYPYHTHLGKIIDLDQSWLDEEHMWLYADAPSDIGGPLPNGSLSKYVNLV